MAAPAPTKKGPKSTGKAKEKTSHTPTEKPVAVDETAKSSGKPDQAAHNAEQEQVKRDIDALTVKLNAVKDKISLTSKSGPGADRRAALREEMDSIRGQQANIKGSRSKLLDQVKAINESTAAKVKALQAAKGKTPYKTVAEVDAHIKSLEKSIESGNLKLGDEKRALAEISTSKKTRRVIESFAAEQAAIDAERAKGDEIRKQLDDPASKAISDRYESIRAELDELKKESDQAYADRNKLYDERSAIQAEIDQLYNKKREAALHFREANDRYWAKINEDRARRAERARATKVAEEEEKKREIAQRIRDEATAPAFQTQIEDCQTLIDYFAGKSGSTPVARSPTPLGGERADLAGVPKLELRKIENIPAEGLIARKKKGEDVESYFVGKGGKAKKTKSANSSPNISNGTLNVPLPTLAALLSLSIPPPTSPADVARTIEDLKTKKAWFEANQTRQTAENIAKAEEDIKRLEKGSRGDKAKDVNGKAEHEEGSEVAKPDEPAVALIAA